MGGIATDSSGRTTVPGLWACGESASAGVHGANRLASNSMLEGLVFSARSAESIVDFVDSVTLPDSSETHPEEPLRADEAGNLATEMARLRSRMSACVGVVRDADGLAEVVLHAAAIERMAMGRSAAVQNSALAARLVATAAYVRCESRGAHFRSDYPTTDPAQARRSQMTLLEADRFLASLESRQVPLGGRSRE